MGGDARQAGELSVDEALRTRLAHLRFLQVVDALPELGVDAVRDAENAVGMRLPDALLAVFAAAIPWLKTEHGMTLPGVVGHTGAARSLGARGDLVAVARAGMVFHCLEKGAPPEAELRLQRYDAADRSLSKTTLPAFLDAAIEAVRVQSLVPEFDPALVSTFRPRLVRPLPESAPGRRVRHRTFGEGKVLQEIGKGENRKVKVDFPGRGLKLLQARFLEYLD